jgi:hypothetical protein
MEGVMINAAGIGDIKPGDLCGKPEEPTKHIGHSSEGLDSAELHTAEPWILVESSEHHGAYITSDYQGDIADLYAMSNPNAASVLNGGVSYPIPFINADANASRIVLCVNACAGITNAELANIIDADGFNTVTKGVLQQRGELLAALKDCRPLTAEYEQLITSIEG